MAELPGAANVRRAMGRRRRLRRGLVSALVVALVAATVWAVGFSPLLAVRQVRVDGATIVTADDVRAAAQVPMGTPLARLDTATIAGKVTSALPAVASATVSRHWPGTLVITIKQRVIVFQVSQGGLFHWVSADGVDFNATPDKQAAVTVAVALGSQALLAAVATVVQATPPEVASHVQSMSAASLDSITLLLDGGRQVVWGSADQSDLKAEVIVALLANVKGKVYDISAPSNPAVR